MKRCLGLSLLVAAWAITLPALADTMRGVVIVVIDGDTVLFKPDHYGARSRAFLKIRLADIDAPEKGQACGDAATRELMNLVLKQHVEINTVATDAYGRSVAHLQKGALQVNAEMVRLGWAWSYARSQNRTAMAAMQDEARRSKRGLWADADPTPPWVWRREGHASAH